MCDFGISGRLIDSIAKTRDAGCQAYMAPERIDPSKAINGQVFTLFRWCSMSFVSFKLEREIQKFAAVKVCPVTARAETGRDWFWYFAHCACRYDVRSDVWSLGITLVEVSRGQFPYPDFTTIFEQLTCVVSGEPPLLRDVDGFSRNYTTFVNLCLIKEFENRPKYAALLETPLLANLRRNTAVVAEYLSSVLPPPTITRRPS